MFTPSERTCGAAALICIAVSLVLGASACSKSSCAETSTCLAEPSTEAPDAEADVSVSEDAGGCDPSAPFESITPVPLSQDVDDFALFPKRDYAFLTTRVRLTQDPLSTPALRLRLVARSSPSDRFGAPVPVYGLQAEEVSYAAVSPDASRLFFIRARATNQSPRDLWLAKLDGTALKDLKPLDSLNDAVTNLINVWPAASRRALYFNRDNPATGVSPLYRAEYVNDDFAAPTEVLFTGAAKSTNRRPAVSSDDRVLYFQRVTGDKAEVVRMARSSDGSAFAGEARDNFLTEHLQFIVWVSDDDCEVYGLQNGSVMRARRGKP